MLQNILGDWGSSLAAEDYACALAALGTLQSRGMRTHESVSSVNEVVGALGEEFSRSERTPIWRSALALEGERDVPSRDSWFDTVYDKPDVLAAAWRQYCQINWEERMKPRLGLIPSWRTETDLFDFNELYNWLRHPMVDLGALVLHDKQAFDHRFTWHWPLRIGVPVGEDQHKIVAMLQEARSNERWVEHLSEVTTVGAGRDKCDLLILTASAVQDILHQPRTRLRATFVACIGLERSDIPFVTDVVGALGRRLQASGIAVVGNLDEPVLLFNWFTGVLRALSHDAPIHSAIYLQPFVSTPTAAVTDAPISPVLIGNAQSLDQCRLLGLAEHQDRVATALEMRKRQVSETRSPPEPVFGGPGRGGDPSPIGGLQARLADVLRLREFDSEVIDGITTAKDLSDYQRALGEARDPRWVQARTWPDEALEQTSKMLAPARWNLVAVHIGPTIVERKDQAFPDSKINFDGKDVPIDVQLEIAGAEIARIDLGQPVTMESKGFSRDIKDSLSRALSDLQISPINDNGETSTGLASCGILLPPVGDSSLALFAVYPHVKTKVVDARIAIVHANRILQTARAQIKVGDRVATDTKAQLDVIAEESVHTTDDDLNERREYDVAIQVSDIGGRLHLIVQRNGTATPVRLDDLSDPIKAIQNALFRVAVDYDYSQSITSQAAFSDVLYTLAAHGTSLKQHLSERCKSDIDKWERMHLVPQTDEFLPLEYVYDGPPPATDAKVCENIVAALKSGSCNAAIENQNKSGPCPNQSNKSYVCPLRFWGFHRLIERNGVSHTATQPAPDSPSNSSICVPSKQKFGATRDLVFAASSRTFKYESEASNQAIERAKLVQSLSSLSNKVTDASDWDTWRTAIKGNPNLLMLVAHTDKHRGAPVLEIGDGKLLGRHEILQDVAGTLAQPRLLILLGCSAAGVTENFQPYPERFRKQGVSIVLAPVAPIRGADAVPIAKKVAKLLGERLDRSEPTALGDLLPLLRRELLSEGHPGVMGLLGFGDGDWLIGGD